MRAVGDELPVAPEAGPDDEMIVDTALGLLAAGPP
jgi:hypothetical protein